MGFFAVAYFGVSHGQGAGPKLDGPVTIAPGGGANCCGCGGGGGGESHRRSNPNILLHVVVQPVWARISPARANNTRKRFIITP